MACKLEAEEEESAVHGEYSMAPSKRKRCTTFNLLAILFTVAIVAAIIIAFILRHFIPRVLAPGRPYASCRPRGHLESKHACQEVGCLWLESKDRLSLEPKCVYPEGYGYVMEGQPVETALGYQVTLKVTSRPAPLFSEDLPTVLLSVEFHSDSRLRIKFSDPEGTRYQVPKEAVDIEAPTQAFHNASRLYHVTFQRQPQFGINVTRRSTGSVVFSTAVPGLTLSDQYLQVTTTLPSAHVYGFGEHNHRTFHHDMNWRKWTIFTRDVAPVDEWNLYGAHPFYMNLEDDGNANAVLLLNSNAMEVVLQPDPTPAVSYHVTGGVLDFYIFLGPSPEQVVQQYTEATGRPIMPPYWSLGFQLSRWDYDNLTHVRTVVERNRAAGIPQDVQYGDIDYMQSKLDFTYDMDKYDGLPDFVQEIKAMGMRYIIILDHAIGSNESSHQSKLGGVYKPFADGVLQDVFIRDGRDPTKYLRGEVWPGEVVYPDFTNVERATQWWKEQCEDFYYSWNITYDALWIDMNEPSNFVPGSTTGCEVNSLNYPPYVPNILGAGDSGRMYDKTICMDALQEWGVHYDVHSLYGHSMSIVTWNALREMFPDERPLVLTRSQFTGSQKYAAHWLGDNQSQWRQIPWSIVGMLEYSLFGFSYTGADICGFWFAATEEMCQRWTLLGAFYPYARNHNAATWPDQDPAAFSPEMTRVSRHILMTRYKLLPFLYTLMHEAHVYGSTVVRPMMHEFIADKKTWTVDAQFLWGPALLITAVLTEGATEVEGYFPDARWYDYHDGRELESPGEWKTLHTPMDKIHLHVRGGHVIPWQEPANNTVYSRQNPMGLIVALGDASAYEAYGSLFWDDGHSYETFQKGDYLLVNFSCSNFVLKMDVANDNYPEARSLVFDVVQIWGLPKEPVWVKVDGQVATFEYSVYTKGMELSALNLTITSNHRIEWDVSF